MNFNEVTSILVCPQVRGNLRFSEADGGFLSEEGVLYPVKHGVVDFVSPGCEADDAKNGDSYKKLAKTYEKSFGFNTPWYVKLYNKIVWGFSDEAYVKDFLAFLPPPSFDGVLLDIPVGTGAYTVEYYKSIPDATIIVADYSLNMIRFARKRFMDSGIENALFIRADVGNLPVKDDSIDHLVSMNGFHAFPEKETAVQSFQRVLKQGGSLSSCFYVKGEKKSTDRVVKSLYTRKRWFTPPYYNQAEVRTMFSPYFGMEQVRNQKAIMSFTGKRKA